MSDAAASTLDSGTSRARSAPRARSGNADLRIVQSPGAPAAVDPMSADIDAARTGDHAAFARLVEATHRDTYALALHLTGCPEDARDVTQEAYLRAFRGLDGFRSDARFTTWMYRITANAAMTHAGRNRRHDHDQLRDDAPIVDLRTEHDPALVADAGDLRDRLLGALGALPPGLRAVVVLRDVYELPHEAIAEELGITVTAAKVRLHRARHRLRLQVFGDRAAGDRVPSGRTDGADRAL